MLLFVKPQNYLFSEGILQVNLNQSNLVPIIFNVWIDEGLQFLERASRILLVELPDVDRVVFAWAGDLVVVLAEGNRINNWVNSAPALDLQELLLVLPIVQFLEIN